MHKVDEDFLKHYGILGMHWGVRKGSGGGSRSLRKPGSPDHERKLSLKGKRIKNMSNTELKDLTTRLQLESSYRKLSVVPKSKARKLVEKIVNDLADTAVKELTKKAGAALLKRTLSKAA